MVPERLSVVTLGVLDLSAMRSFYQGLGWATNSQAEDFAAFPLGGAVLCLYEVEKLAEEAAGEVPSLSQNAFKGFTLAVNVAERDEVDASLAVAVKAGGRPLSDPVDRDWGGRSAYFADPESNAWEIAWLPDSRFDERGALIWPY
jgi:predicted lactoylglutathione lyase